MSYVANLSPRSPFGTSREKRTQRRSLKGGSEIEVHPTKELAEPGWPTTKNRQHDPEARGNRDHQPQKDAAEKQECQTGSDRTPRRLHGLIVGRLWSPVFG